MTGEQVDRLTIAWETIGKALEGIHDELKRAGSKYWPEPKEQKEAIVTRIPNAEDETRRNLGVDDSPIKERIERGDWLDIGPTEDEDEFIGEREREWRKAHPKEQEKAEEPASSPEVGEGRKPKKSSSKPVKGKG